MYISCYLYILLWYFNPKQAAKVTIKYIRRQKNHKKIEKQVEKNKRISGIYKIVVFLYQTKGVYDREKANCFYR